jgi:hypothetical protein
MLTSPFRQGFHKTWKRNALLLQGGNRPFARYAAMLEHRQRQRALLHSARRGEPAISVPACCRIIAELIAGRCTDAGHFSQMTARSSLAHRQ